MRAADRNVQQVGSRPQRQRPRQRAASKIQPVRRAPDSDQLRIEYFPALEAIANVRAAFIARIPGIDVSADKAEALERLDAVHRKYRDEMGIGDWPLLTAQQVHGNKIIVV